MLQHSITDSMEKLDRILDACVAKGDKTSKDELLGAAFVVVDKDSEPAPPNSLCDPIPHSLTAKLQGGSTKAQQGARPRHQTHPNSHQRPSPG